MLRGRPPSLPLRRDALTLALLVDCPPTRPPRDLGMLACFFFIQSHITDQIELIVL